MFHVERMNKKQTLFKAKDHLVSQETFSILWNKEGHYAETSIPDSTNLPSYYQTEEYSSHKTEATTIFDFLYKTVQSRMLSYKAGIIKSHATENILDIGAGVGVFAEYLLKKKKDVTAVEPNEMARNACRNKGISSYKSITDLPHKKKYTVITMWHVLEHLPSPASTLDMLHALMHTNGLLVVAVPNFNSHDAKHYASDWAALDVPRHLWHFTEKGLRGLVEAHGFVFRTKKPLWFDAFYIAYISEKNKKKRFPFMRGMIVGLLSNIKALFDGEYSSVIYVFEKQIIR
jgi:2-polyprenyl-3-methyl-5-hydroxy-6-metoxy-1,4-benzoquinol methylase